MRNIKLSAFIVIIFVFGCSPEQSNKDVVKLKVDMFGFILNVGGKRPTVNLALGQSGESFVAANPDLKGAVWLPRLEEKNVFNQMRLSLQAESDFTYSDGDLIFSACAHRLNVDGNDSLPLGVAYVEIKLCEAPKNDYMRAITIAKETILQLENRNINIVNLDKKYVYSSKYELDQLGGEALSRLSKARDIEESGAYLYSYAGAEKYYFEKVELLKKSGKPLDAVRPHGYHTLLGVYLSKNAIISVSVGAWQFWGGSNLSEEQRNDIRYDVTVAFELKKKGTLTENE